MEIVECICHGVTADPEEFIFKAQIVEGPFCSWKYARCGATLITKTHVLTAAHCIVNTYVKRLKVILGGTLQNGTDGVVYSVRKFRIHKDYKKFSMTHDIGIVVVSKLHLIKYFWVINIIFSLKVKPCCFVK